MARILLVHPLLLAEQPAEREAASPYFPLGVLSLAAWVRERGHEVAVYDGTFEPDRSSFDRRLASVAPDVVGLSCLLPTRAAALDLAARARAAGALVVAGGPDPTADPEPYLTGGAVDVVVHHEGEQTITALLDRIDAGTLRGAVSRAEATDAAGSGPLGIEDLTDEPGVAFASGGRIVVTAARAPLDDLDALPDPARDLIDLDRYLEAWEATAGYRSATVVVSRGCPRDCRWCAAGVHGPGFRQRSPESVAAEVARLRDTYDIDRLRLVDDVEAMDGDWFERWAGDLEARGATIGFEALDRLERTDLPLFDPAHPL